MSLRIRLALHGPPHKRIFHLVAIGLKKRRNAKPTELLGIYNPHTNPKTLDWGVDRIKYWLEHGAQPSKSAVKFLEMGKILSPDSKYHTPRKVSEQLAQPVSASPTKPKA